MKKLLIIFFLGFIVTCTAAQQTATGYVYEDTNLNLKRDRKEKGIPGVAVSNGRNVVLTDLSGKYSLETGPDNILFVIKPAGYATPVNGNNLPRFFYIHKPAGSPDLKFAGVDPTGVLPSSVDFPLSQTQERDSFHVLLFGDPQAYNKRELQYFDKRIVSELNDKAGTYAFGISAGDLVGNDPDLFLPYAEVMNKIGIPWYNVIGNHDLNHDAMEEQYADESFEKVFGPSTYAFNYGKAHFIIIKNILWPDPRDKNGYWGGFTEQQFAFLKNDLSHVPKDHLVVMVFHIPIWEGYVDNDIFRDEDRARLFTLLKDFPHNLTISAHSHIQYNKMLSADDGWLQENPHHHYNLGTTCGAWYSGALGNDGIPWSVMADGTPQGYAMMSVNGNNYEISYKVAGAPASEQMKIHHPKIIAKTPKTQASLTVNFYMGSEKDEVVFRVDGGKWTPMKYIIDEDPAYLQLLHTWDITEEVIPGRRPNEPRNCLHLWRAPLPSDLEVGEHIIEVKTTDMYGRIHNATSTYKTGLPKGKK